MSNDSERKIAILVYSVLAEMDKSAREQDMTMEDRFEIGLEFFSLLYGAYTYLLKEQGLLPKPTEFLQ